MTHLHTQQPGLGSGRNWGAVDAEDNFREWAMDPNGGMVQGPVDLDFARGRRLKLTLEPGQCALLVRDNHLQAVYLDGGHILEVGHGERQVPPSSCLVFLAADQALQLRWTKLNPVTGSCLPEPGAIGHCALFVEAPARFYKKFLSRTTAWDEQSLQYAVDQAARRALAEILEPCAGLGEAELQTRLTGLQPEDLSEGLAEIGLACCRIAVYTATPPSELADSDRAGQSAPLSHNN